MKLWLDTDSVAEAEQFAAWGVLAGATTSRERLDAGGAGGDARYGGAGAASGAPTVDAGAANGAPGVDADTAIVRLCDLLDASVLVSLPSGVSDAGGHAAAAQRLIAAGEALAQLHENAIAAVPCSPAGLIAVSALAEQELPVAVTHVFSAAQALLAAEAGAALVVTSLVRMEEAAIDAGETLQAIVESLHGGESTTEALAAGIRTPQQAVLAARLGADGAAVPAAVLRRMLEHPLTAAALDRAPTP